MAEPELKSVSGFASFGTICLYISIAMSALTAISELGLWVMGPPVHGSMPHIALGVLLMFLAALQLVLLVVTAFAVCQWMFRAYQNLVLVKTEGLKYSAADAITYWFIPITNLVRPYQIMKELYFGSSSGGEAKAKDISKEKSPSVLITWWSCWILAAAVADLSFVAKGHYELVMASSMTAAVLSAVSAISLVNILKIITNNLETKIPQLKTI